MVFLRFVLIFMQFIALLFGIQHAQSGGEEKKY